MIDDPFGQRTVRANMHPGYQNPDVIGPSGPVDPALTVLSVQARDRPADRRAGQLLDALLRCATGLGRLLRPVRRGSGETDRAPPPSMPPFVGHHVAGHQRRPDVDGLRPAQEGPRPGRLCRGRRPRRPTKPIRRSPITTGSRWRWPRRRSSSAAACRTRSGWPGPPRSWGGQG